MQEIMIKTSNDIHEQTLLEITPKVLVTIQEALRQMLDLVMIMQK